MAAERRICRRKRRAPVHAAARGGRQPEHADPGGLRRGRRPDRPCAGQPLRSDGRAGGHHGIRGGERARPGPELSGRRLAADQRRAAVRFPVQPRGARTAGQSRHLRRIRRRTAAGRVDAGGVRTDRPRIHPPRQRRKSTAGSFLRRADAGNDPAPRPQSRRSPRRPSRRRFRSTAAGAAN